MAKRLELEGRLDGVYYRLKTAERKGSGRAASYLELRQGTRRSVYRLRIDIGSGQIGSKDQFLALQKQKVESIVCGFAKSWKNKDQIGRSKRVDVSVRSAPIGRLTPSDVTMTCSSRGKSYQVAPTRALQRAVMDMTQAEWQHRAVRVQQRIERVVESNAAKKAAPKSLSERTVVPLSGSERLRRVFTTALDNERAVVGNRKMTYFHSYQGKVYGSEKVTFLPALDQYERILYQYVSNPFPAPATPEDHLAKTTLIYQKLSILTLEKLRRTKDAGKRNQLISNFVLFYSHACHEIAREDFKSWKNVSLALVKELKISELTRFVESRRGDQAPERREYQFVAESMEDKDQKLSCRYYRNLLEKHHGTEVTADEADQRAALEYLPALINLMRHEVSCFDKGVGRASVEGTEPSMHKKWLRFGVFYDNRSSLFTMGEMRALQQDYTDGNCKWSTSITGGGLARRLDHCKSKAEVTKFQEFKGRFSAKSLRKAEHKSMASQAAIRSSRKMLGMEDGRDEINIDRLKRTMAEREVILETQMLQLLCNQVSEHPEQIKSGQGVFKMAHVAYLNLGKRKVEKGWTHFENNEVQDMNWIFEQFKGKTLVFDGQGPLVSGNVVHLPFRKEDAEGHPIELKLDCRFFNISVQGAGLRQGKLGAVRGFITGDGLAGNEELRTLQRDINRGKFRAAGKDAEGQFEFDTLRDRVESGESRFELATDLTHALVKNGFATSGSCQSSKDRAGLTLALTAQRFVEESIQTSDIDEQDKEYVARSLTIPPMGEHQLPVTIVRNDIGERALKVSPFSLPNRKQFFWIEGSWMWRIFHLVNSLCFAKTT